MHLHTWPCLMHCSFNSNLILILNHYKNLSESLRIYIISIYRYWTETISLNDEGHLAALCCAMLPRLPMSEEDLEMQQLTAQRKAREALGKRSEKPRKNVENRSFNRKNQDRFDRSDRSEKCNGFLRWVSDKSVSLLWISSLKLLWVRYSQIRNHTEATCRRSDMVKQNLNKSLWRGVTWCNSLYVLFCCGLAAGFCLVETHSMKQASASMPFSFRGFLGDFGSEGTVWCLSQLQKSQISHATIKKGTVFIKLANEKWHTWSIITCKIANDNAWNHSFKTYPTILWMTTVMYETGSREDTNIHCKTVVHTRVWCNTIFTVRMPGIFCLKVLKLDVAAVISSRMILV